MIIYPIVIDAVTMKKAFHSPSYSISLDVAPLLVETNQPLASHLSKESIRSSVSNTKEEFLSPAFA